MDAENNTSSNSETKVPEDGPVAAFVAKWTGRIDVAREWYEKTAFKRMRACMHIAKTGGAKEWTAGTEIDDKVVVPILNRHINQTVAHLYAKNPKPLIERKRRRMGSVWDGSLASLQEAATQVQQATDAGLPPDPHFTAVISDAASVQQYIRMMDGLADTLTILYEHFMREQVSGYKQQFKALVRRARVCGVGYVTLGFQRLLDPRPDKEAAIRDVTEQIATIEQRMRANERGEIDDDSPKLEELRAALETLRAEPALIAREGPVLGFPRATRVIIDPNCTHLKTLTGADWWAEEFDMTPEQVEAIYRVDIRGNYKEFKSGMGDGARPRWSDKKGKTDADCVARVYRVQQKSTGLEFTICVGYPGYLSPPAAPDVRIERFFTLFPLVFNECEDEDEIIPPSDVWQARHQQFEYNRSRHGLREHRVQNRPGYYSPSGSLLDGDKSKLQNRVSGEIVEVGALVEGQRLADRLAAIPTVPIDPNLYEVETIFNDMLRVVGAQQANLGATAGDTATETSIAENSRMTSMADNVDDLDDMLSELARAMGQLMLTELSKETVIEIVGPGAVWPDTPMTRDEVAKDLLLDIKAGSSGRPNRAAELANMERGMPYILQLPRINPVPIAQKFLGLLEIDVEGAVVEGMPSITALNAMAARQVQLSTGDPQTDPNAQGAKGGDNASRPSANEPGAQPAYPSATSGPPAT